MSQAEEKQLLVGGVDVSKMERVSFTSGVTRYIHVDTAALEDNKKHKISKPTMVVVDGEKVHKFHVLKFSSCVMKMGKQQNVDASLFIETQRNITGYIDHDAVTTVPMVKTTIPSRHYC